MFNCVIDITVVIFTLKVKVFDKDYKWYGNAFKIH